MEGFVENAKEKYGELGHTCKDYTLCEVDQSGDLKKFNFCSHEVSDGNFYLTTWPKTLYRFLGSANESYHELEAELLNNPNWQRIKRYLSRVGSVPVFESEGNATKEVVPCPPEVQEWLHTEKVQEEERDYCCFSQRPLSNWDVVPELQ